MAIIAMLADGRATWAETTKSYPFRSIRPVGEPWPDEIENHMTPAGQYIVCTFDGLTHIAFTHESDWRVFEDEWPETEEPPRAFRQ